VQLLHEEKQVLSGIIPALLTPLDASDQVDTHSLCALVAYLLASKVDGLYLCGSTGEGILLSEAERRTVTETVIQQVAGRVPVIVHIGAAATPTAARLAAHARAAGAHAVASIPPFYYSVGIAGVELFYRQICAAAGGLPCYFYNIPDATQFSLTAGLAKSLYSQGVIQGCKYTSYDLLTLRAIIEDCGPGLNVFSGPDEMLLPFLVMGVHGGIGTTYNPLPRLYRRLYDAYRAGDLAGAQALQYQADRIILVIARYGVIPATKAAMRLAGVPCGDPRPPLVRLTEEQVAQLTDELAAVGFFDWVGTGR